MSAELTVSLPHFEGPLDLLLALVRKNQVPITEIPIAEITRQYLEYVHRAQELNIDLGGEFTYMAATLILIKTRKLLPRDRDLIACEDDPQEELIRQLVDREQVRRAAEYLEQRLEANRTMWTRPSTEQIADQASPHSQEMQLPDSLNLLEVLRLAQRALEIARARQTLDIERKAVTVGEMVQWLEPLIHGLKQTETLRLEKLFRLQPSVARKVALFLAILELSRAGKVLIQQDGPLMTLCVNSPPTASSAS